MNTADKKRNNLGIVILNLLFQAALNAKIAINLDEHCAEQVTRGLRLCVPFYRH